MTKKHLKTTQPNSWRHNVKGRRTFGSYKIPPKIITECGVRDGQKRNITFKTQKSEQFTLDASITSGCEISLPKKYQEVVRGNDFVEISILAKKAFIFVKPEFAGKTEKQIRTLINGRHPDHRTLIYLMQGLKTFGYNMSLLKWSEFDTLRFDGTELIVVPQRAYISGGIGNFNVFAPRLQQAIDLGSNLLLTHHHQYEFHEYFGIRSFESTRGYFQAQIESLRLNDNESVLIDNVEQFWLSAQKISDEFTYLPSATRNGFISVVQKIPKRVPKGVSQHEPFLCLAYKKLSSRNYVFLIDVHASGSKKGDNGKLFKLLLRNSLTFLSNESNNIENAEERIINGINTSSISKTEKEALIASRIGQGKFRNNLIAYWKGCAATKLKKQSLLRASHIKPWCVCNNAERLDTFNGLLLIPNLDQAFDQGYITFDNKGIMIISSSLSEHEVNVLGIKRGLVIPITAKHHKYMKYHRKYVFKK